MNIKQGDSIVITRGKDRGKKAKVLRVFVQKNRITAEGVNLHKKHQRQRRSNEKGQVISFPAPFSAANVKLVCSSCDKGVRVRYSGVSRDKVRVCASCGQKL